MQKQAFHEETNTAPRYDSETVRRVLARASELETQPEPDQLTPAQIEALGAELGMNPNAVRRALGELVPTQTATVIRSATRLTKTQIRDAVIAAVGFALANAILFSVIRGLFVIHPVPSLLIAMACYPPSIAATFYSMKKSNVKEGVLHGFLMSLLNVAFLIVCSYIPEGTFPVLFTADWMILLGSIIILPAISFIAGYSAQEMDKLQRKND